MSSELSVYDGFSDVTVTSNCCRGLQGGIYYGQDDCHLFLFQYKFSSNSFITSCTFSSLKYCSQSSDIYLVYRIIRKYGSEHPFCLMEIMADIGVNKIAYVFSSNDLPDTILDNLNEMK